MRLPKCIVWSVLCYAIISGCSTTPEMIRKGDVQLGMSLTDFNNTMLWGAYAESDPGMESWGGSGYDRYFQDHLIVYGGDRERVFIFDNRSVLVAITESIEEAEKLVLRARASGSGIQNLQTKSARRWVRAPDLSGLDSDIRSSIDVACVMAKTEGLALYNECVNDQLASIRSNANRVASDETKKRSQQPFNQDSERVKALERRLAKLEAEKNTKQQAIAQDTQPPALRILGKYTEDESGVFKGLVSDNVEVAELRVNGRPISFDSSGRFTHKEYLPSGDLEFIIVAIDRAGLKTMETVRLTRELSEQVAQVAFDRLNPTTRNVRANNNAMALIVGVSEYSLTAPAEFADRDAQVFYDYARLKLGIPQERIQTLINDKADEIGLLSGINKWLKRSVRQGESDVYIFFAGHGLASDNGDTAYLIPYDGAPDFLEKTAISRDEVFREISSVNPRSVTVFLDTCYSGNTRGETRLRAGRPLNIKLQEQSLPKGFTVLTAAGGDQIAKPLKEAQHGMFSYFLMKGMEGGADADGNNEISARELHTYVRENVVQQSGGSQIPELQGDADRMLVRFQ